MNSFEVILYFICFALIAGAAFAMMWQNLQSLTYEYKGTRAPRHPEAPQAGEELMYVDFEPEEPAKYLESLEKLMQRESPWAQGSSEEGDE